MDITKQEFNRTEFREAIGICDSEFSVLKKYNLIPTSADDRVPHVWHRATVLRTIDELNRLKTKAPK